MEQFAAAFTQCGFRREAFYPCYGLAEATLIVSGGKKAALPVVQKFQGSALEKNRAIATLGENEDIQTLIGCGQTASDQKIVVVNPESRTQCQPEQVGEIWVSGPSVAQGYWNRFDETEHTFRAYLSDTGKGPFLRTGDLGFVHKGELFITGRLKDLIIIRGRNHYPQDIELTVEQSHPALRLGCGGAFSVDALAQERLVVVQEVERHYRNPDVDEIVAAVRQAVSDNHELQVYAVLLVKTGSIPKTSSGKIQRHACRTGFLKGTLDVIGSSVLEDTYSTSCSENLTREALLAIEPESQPPLLMSYLQEQVAQVLRVAASELDPQKSLSTLGLDSLMAIELKNDIETNLGVVLPMTHLLQSPSIAQLAIAVLTQLTAPTSISKTTLAPVQSVGDEHPLSYGQRSLWFLHQLARSSPAYNIVNAVRIRADVDIPALQRAFQALVDRHPSLRTTFHGEPVQQIHEHRSVCFQQEDASGDRESLNARLLEEAHRPFNLEQGPLLRVSLFSSSQEHILLLVVHHIVSDFWSLAVLVQELGILYQAQKAGTPATLAPLTLQYTDYVHAHSEMLASPEGERLWAYWQKQLAGELPVLDLHTDRPRPPVQTYQGATHTIKLSTALTKRIKALSRAHETTLYMTLLAAFQVLLYRYTGQEDILVGSPTAGRNWAELAGLVGYFVNPVVLRADLSENPTFEEFLGQVRQTVLYAFEHQDYPFALLVERLQPVRDPSRSPLFQAMFVLQKAPKLNESGLTAFALGETGVRMNLGGLELESFALEQRMAQFDLTLMMAEVEGGLAASFEYNTDLFEAVTINRMAEHFQIMLTGIVANPHLCVSTLPLLTPDERHQLLVEWNDTQTDYPEDQCIHELFTAQVERTPDAIAVVFQDKQLTYRQLNSQANQLAHHLKSLGVGPEVRVGICMERSLEMVVGILGILKAGGAYVPLDPTYPQERLAFMLQDSQVPVLLTQERLLNLIPDTSAQMVLLDTDWGKIAQHSQENPVTLTDSNNLAYVIYTSGSTGKPKGVLIQHQGVVNHGVAMSLEFELNSKDRILQFASISFDIAVEELFPSWFSGATVVLRTDQMLSSIADFLQGIEQARVSVVNLPTAFWHEWVHGMSARAYTMPPDLRLVIVGGEKASPTAYSTWLQHVGDRLRWLNAYGPTETTVTATVYEPAKYALNQEVISELPIGRPIANTQIYLLDSQLQPVPIGVPGEMYIGGAGVARGYLNRPDLTPLKFIPNPYSSGYLYKTGDLARYLLDASILYLGRIDDQVKIRGFRIELGEIEAVLRQHPAIQEAVVLVHENATNDKRLVAYVVSQQEQAPTSMELRRFLKEQLPEYMTPSVFVVLDTLPLTPNGKLDRRSLPAPDWTRPDGEGTFVAPRNPVEEVVALIWSEILGIEHVGIYDNFFDLGGHSLLATQVMSRLRDTFGVELPLHNLFEATSVAKLSELLITNETKPGKTEKIAQVLKKIAAMSATDVKETLQQKKAKA